MANPFLHSLCYLSCTSQSRYRPTLFPASSPTTGSTSPAAQSLGDSRLKSSKELGVKLHNEVCSVCSVACLCLLLRAQKPIIRHLIRIYHVSHRCVRCFPGEKDKGHSVCPQESLPWRSATASTPEQGTGGSRWCQIKSKWKGSQGH